MSTTIGSATTPAVTTPTTTPPPPATDRQAEAAACIPVETTADAFVKAEKAPVALTTPAAEEDDWGDCEFDTVKSGGGGIAALDPSNGGTRIRG
jgi:hypothetical protein